MRKVIIGATHFTVLSEHKTRQNTLQKREKHPYSYRFVLLISFPTLQKNNIKT